MKALLAVLIIFAFAEPLSAGGGLGITPSAYDFGVQNVSTLSPRAEFIITNASSSPASIKSISIEDVENYEFDPKSGKSPCKETLPVLDAGESCTISVRLAPQKEGVLDSRLIIEVHDGDAVSAVIKGIGIPCGC